MLPDQGSNLDCQSQNLTYYHYTIGQLRTAKLFFYFEISQKYISRGDHRAGEDFLNFTGCTI